MLCEELGQVFYRDFTVRRESKCICILVRCNVQRFVEEVLPHCNAVTPGIVKAIAVSNNAVRLLHIDDAGISVAKMCIRDRYT